MSSLDDYAAVRAPLPATPKGFEPQVVVEEGKGAAQNIPAPENADDRKLMEEAGLDPDAYVITGGRKHRRWQMMGEWQFYWAFNFEPRTADTSDERQADVAALAAMFKKKPAPYKPTLTGDDAFVLVAADFQVGKSSEHTINRWREGVQAAKQRVKDLRRMGHAIPNGAIVGLGDLVEGCDGHYAIQTFSVDLDRRGQVKVARRMVREAIDELAPLFSDFLVTGVGGNHGECLDEGTELLTKDGWKKVNECSISDTFATLNPASSAFEWQSPTAYNVWEYNGPMLHFRSRAVDLMVTPTHDLWTTFAGGSWESLRDSAWEKCPASARRGRARTYFKHAAESWTGVSEPVTIPEFVDALGRRKTEPYVIPDLLSFARLCGWYVAEGYIGAEARVSIAQSRSANPDHYQEIEVLLKDLGLNPRPNKDERQIRFSHAGVSRFLKDNFGGNSGAKRVPAFVLGWSAELQREFLDAYSRGDGHRYSGTGRSYKTKSQSLIDGIQEIAIKLGMRCSSGKTRDYPVANTQYVGRATEFYVNDRSVSYATAPAEVPYSGKVYCPTVPNGLVFVRRNGKVVVTGNSRKDGKAFTTMADNDDVALLEMLHEAVQGRPGYEHVRFAIPNDELATCVEIGGVALGITHGHLLRSGGKLPQNKALEWWKGQMMGLRPVSKAQILLTGHYHHLLVSTFGPRTHLQAPALDGGSAWWEDMTGMASPDGVLTFRLDKNHPLGWSDLLVL